MSLTHVREQQTDNEESVCCGLMAHLVKRRFDHTPQNIPTKFKWHIH